MRRERYHMELIAWYWIELSRTMRVSIQVMLDMFVASWVKRSCLQWRVSILFCIALPVHLVRNMHHLDGDHDHGGGCWRLVVTNHPLFHSTDARTVTAMLNFTSSSLTELILLQMSNHRKESCALNICWILSTHETFNIPPKTIPSIPFHPIPSHPIPSYPTMFPKRSSGIQITVPFNLLPFLFINS